MKVKTIQEKDKWNQWVQENNGSFLQSWEWGAFQYSYGREVKYLIAENQGQIVAGTLLIKHALPASRFYYFSPYGPVKYSEEILEWMQIKAQSEKVIFWRLETVLAERLSGFNLVKVKNVHPQTSLVLNLQNKDEDQLLREMKAKTRYNIRLAQKKGVTVRVSSDMKDIDIFYNLVTTTAQRQKIRIHPKSYYQTMFHTLGDSGFLKIYLAEYKHKVLAANLIVFFNDTVTYLHGGMSREHREVMAPHLLQWRAICDARQAGFKYYDFFGIADNDDPDHPWAGITRFKKGFGGDVKRYAGTKELPLNKIWYNAYRITKKIKS